MSDPIHLNTTKEALRLADPDDRWDPGDETYRLVVQAAREEISLVEAVLDALAEWRRERDAFYAGAFNHIEYKAAERRLAAAVLAAHTTTEPPGDPT